MAVTEAGFRREIRSYIEAEARPREKFGHQPRLYRLCGLIGAGLEYDDDVVFAAAWLHDIGVFAGHRPEDPVALACWDNTAYAMKLAPELLGRFGFPVDKIAAVVEAIRTHQPSGEPLSMEGLILHDADILEQLGAIGILRTVCKVGRDTRFHSFTDAVEALRKALTTLLGLLRLDSARRLAQAKIAALRNFLEAVDSEAADELF
jgi:uncharacterized protein